MYFWLALAAAIAVFSAWRWGGRRSTKPTVNEPKHQEKLDGKVSIEPLKTFDWLQTPPAKHRSFKSVYHITMGKLNSINEYETLFSKLTSFCLAIQASPPDELIIMDSNYLDRVTERRETIKQYPSMVLGTLPEGIPALHETWLYLLKEYLPSRYPTIFSLSDDGRTFHNKVTKTSLPLTPPEDPKMVLQALGETVEDDIFLLVETPEGHRAVAFVCCHPAGFDPSDKLGKLLKDIHTPVPSYEKIGASMERFFCRLQVGKSVKRMNWSISTAEQLFRPSGLHIYEGDEHEENEDIDISKTRLRQELQTLTRLPKTGAIMFSFKTYMTPLEQIKNEGLGPQVADAIEGLKTGNAPGMWVYKGATRWGKSACEYLRS